MNLYFYYAIVYRNYWIANIVVIHMNFQYRLISYLNMDQIHHIDGYHMKIVANKCR